MAIDKLAMLLLLVIIEEELVSKLQSGKSTLGLSTEYRALNCLMRVAGDDLASLKLHAVVPTNGLQMTAHRHYRVPFQGYDGILQVLLSASVASIGFIIARMTEVAVVLALLIISTSMRPDVNIITNDEVIMILIHGEKIGMPGVDRLESP